MPREVRELATALAGATAAVAWREQRLRAAGDQQELLIQEIHHRVKNNLQIVASLLNLQANRIRQPSARAEFQSARDRVRALATLHRHLYTQSELHAINMKSFLEELCGQLFQAMGEQRGRRITLDIAAPALRLSSDQAVPLALIVTEAVSNALKYAFPDGRSGHVSVRLTAGTDIAELVIEDDGVGIPAGVVETETGRGMASACSSSAGSPASSAPRSRSARRGARATSSACRCGGTPNRLLPPPPCPPMRSVPDATHLVCAACRWHHRRYLRRRSTMPDLAETLTTWRRHLHAHPELGMEEHATAEFVQARLAELGIAFVAGVGRTGVVATLSRGASNRAVGLRADMDALPIAEETGLAYASTRPGVMHACGHDGHTATLLGAAALLRDDPSWTGIIHFVFQPAEEGLGGARAMLADGLFERFPMERIFAYHNWPGLEAGTVAVHDGPVMAAGSRVEIRLLGHAGHAAMPHQARDPMLAAAHLLVALQSVVSRNVDPLDAAVLSICTMQTGEAVNQIPREVTMRGTYRTHRPAVDARVEASIRRLAAGIAAAFEMTAEVEIRHGAAGTANSMAEAEIAAQAAEAAALALRRDLPPSMAGEDFGWYLHEKPGAFVWIGNGPAEAGRQLHNPRYDFNDAILPAAAGWMAAVAKRALQEGG